MQLLKMIYIMRKKARFSFDESGKLVVNQDAPAYYAVAPAKAVKAYRGGRGVELTLR